MAQLIGIKTRRLMPPRDTLLSALVEADFRPCNGDVLVLSSKVVAIDEGRCVAQSETDKTDLVAKEADAYIPKRYNKYGFELSIVHYALIASAGVDGSNCGDYYTLLPKKPMESARRLHRQLCDIYGLTDFGVVIADSHSLPMRRGIQDISIGFWGFNPLKDYRGTKDLFGHELRVSQANIPDTLAAAAGGIMGQGAECIPAVLCRDWPNIVFDAETDYSAGFLIPHDDDIFNVMTDVFYTKGEVKSK